MMVFILKGFQIDSHNIYLKTNKENIFIGQFGNIYQYVKDYDN